MARASARGALDWSAAQPFLEDLGAGESTVALGEQPLEALHAWLAAPVSRGKRSPVSVEELL